MLHEYLRWQELPRPKVENQIPFNEELSQKIRRLNGDKAYLDYINSFREPEKEKNIPKLQIFNNCELLIGAIKACIYAKSSKEGVPAEDVQEFDGDDPYDTVRYLVDRADRYFQESEEEFKRLMKVSELEDKLQKDQDYTSFYMKARALEAEMFAKKERGIRRYHR